MSPSDVEIVVIGAAWSASVGVIGLAVGWGVRHRSLRWVPLVVAVVAVASVVAGMVGTARAMFLSEHDFAVVLQVSFVAGVVSTTFAMVLGAGLVRSSKRLREDARRFGEEGHFAGGPGGPAEFGELSAELSRTSARLNEARRQETRLEESRRELVSWVSHDLRTPLAGLRAMTEALEDGLAEDPGRYHRQMRGEVDRMVRMVDDLFELSRIHAGVLRLTPESVAVGDVVSDALAGAEPVARAGGVRLSGRVEDGLVVRADVAGLSRVVTNLVSNAIRHTPRAGAVQIEGRAVPEGVELSVSDGCGGIEGDDLDRVFDVAWTGERARTPRPPETVPGSTWSATEAPPGLSSGFRPGYSAGFNSGFSSGAGLGLAIVRGIVEAHQGRVSVDNGEFGCRFRVLLPG